jgi:hypothetical protein
VPGVLLVGEGSGCLDSVFVSLDTVHSWRCCRRRLLRGEDCGRSFLIPRGRASINDQSEYTTGVNGLLTFAFWHRALPPNFLDVSFCLAWGHIDWREEGQEVDFMLPLRLTRGCTEVSEVSAERRV